MIDSVIVPLVQNKCGNLADNNSYRPIALFSIIIKGVCTTLNMSFCFALKTIYAWTNNNTVNNFELFSSCLGFGA